jgi:two-component system nitrate/nitrite response regulator NarL
MQTAMTRANGPGRVLLVDDHPAVRRVLRSLLEEVGGWEVVGEADSGEAALPLVEQLTPDVVLMDCRMPGQGGVAATREIVRRWPEVAVVAHTAYADETYVREMVAAGARGYVLKGDVPAAVRTTDLLARYGGEEFGLLLPACSVEDAIDVIKRVQAATPDEVTVSIGLASWDFRESAAELVRQQRRRGALPRQGRRARPLRHRGGAGLR